MNKVYIISGPAGVGKSTTARQLAAQFDHSSYIEGDLVYHMVVGGHRPPWESEEQVSLLWDNLADLSINFLQAKKQVVIDYVAFPEDVQKFSQQLKAKLEQVEIVYVVLWVEPEELLRRDGLRDEDHQMGVRCIELLKEFDEKKIEERFFLSTTDQKSHQLQEVMIDIMENPRFIYQN